MARGSFRPGRFRTKCDPDEWMIHTMSSSVSSSSWKASHASRAVLKLISLGCTSNISAVSHMRSRTRLYARMATAISRSRLSGVRRQAAEFAHTHRGFIRPDIDFRIPHPTSHIPHPTSHLKPYSSAMSAAEKRCRRSMSSRS